MLAYLDHNATAPVLPAVREAVSRAMLELPGNAHSPHAAGRAAAAAVELARGQIGALLGCPARTVRFCSGATEANSWALSGSITAAQGRGVTDPVVLVSAVEHESVRAWGSHLIPVDADGVVDVAALVCLLEQYGESVAVVSVMAANNETGVLQPVQAVARACRAAGVLFHSDITQLPGRLACAVPADLLTLSAHKCGGPKGIGALVCATPPPPLLRGGPQERGSRAGTVAVPLVVGFGLAAALAGVGDPAARDRLEAGCVALGARVLGATVPRLPNTCTVIFPVPGDLIVMGLDLAGVAASTGSACASGAVTSSHVMAAMGEAAVPVRFSLGTDPELAHLAVDAALQRLPAVLDQVRAAQLPETGLEAAP